MKAFMQWIFGRQLSVNEVLAKYQRDIDDLEVISQDNVTAAEKCEQRIELLEAEIQRCDLEALRAVELSQKLKALMV